MGRFPIARLKTGKAQKVSLLSDFFVSEDSLESVLKYALHSNFARTKKLVAKARKLEIRIDALMAEYYAAVRVAYELNGRCYNCEMQGFRKCTGKCRP